MREILFRGKRVDNGEWVEGYYFKATHHWHNHGVHEDWIAVDTIQNGGYCNVRGKYAIIPETLGQFTGLTDKNGKRIFDGDIVEGLDFTAEDGGYGVVTFDDGAFEVVGSCDNNIVGTFHENYYGKDFEIIGNIHDNGELLTAERREK